MFEVLLFFAQEPKGAAPDIWTMPLFLLVMVALFWLIVLRPARRQEQERMSMIRNMKKNDKVLTTAGIYGTVVSVSDKEDEVVVKVDDNTRLRMTKGSILRNISAEEAKAQQASKDTKKDGGEAPAGQTAIRKA